MPFPAGGPTDTLARILADRMRTTLGQPIIIENVSGAGGSIGVGRVARAAPDGYTLGIGHWNTQVAPALRRPYRFDLLLDFEPVAHLRRDPDLDGVTQGLAGEDLKELIAWLKEKGGKASRLGRCRWRRRITGGVLFEQITGTHFQFVPYRGAAPVMQDLVAGHIDFTLGIPRRPSAGRGRPDQGLGHDDGVALARRAGLPTMDEAGLPGLFATFWPRFGAQGHADGHLTKLNAAVVSTR